MKNSACYLYCLVFCIFLGACDPQETPTAKSLVVTTDASPPTPDAVNDTGTTAPKPGSLVDCLCKDGSNGTCAMLSDGSFTACNCPSKDGGIVAPTPDAKAPAPDTTPSSTVTATATATTATATNTATSTGTASATADAPVVPVCVPVLEVCGNDIDDNCDGKVDNIELCSVSTGTTSSSQTASNTSTGSSTGTGICTNSTPLTIVSGGCTNLVQCVDNAWTITQLMCTSTVTATSTVTSTSTVTATSTSTVDTTPPTVVGMSVPGGSILTVGVVTMFSVTASDDVGVVACQLIADGVIMGPMSQVGGNLWAVSGIPSVSQLGTHAFTAECQDAADNKGYSEARMLTVVDGTSTATGTSTNTGTGTATSTSTEIDLGCHDVLVQNQFQDILNGEIVTCSYNGVSGQQQCVDGKMSPCSATSQTISGLQAVINCSQINNNTGTVLLTGNIAGNLYWTGDASAIVQVCLVGDSIGGMSEANRIYCGDYHPDSSFSYVFEPLFFASGENRITFFGVTENNGVRWSNNQILVLSNDPENRCSKSNTIVDGVTSKLVFTPSTQQQ